jgi:hypothetical protein
LHIREGPRSSDAGSRRDGKTTFPQCLQAEGISDEATLSSIGIVVALARG